MKINWLNKIMLILISLTGVVNSYSVMAQDYQHVDPNCGAVYVCTVYPNSTTYCAKGDIPSSEAGEYGSVPSIKLDNSKNTIAFDYQTYGLLFGGPIKSDHGTVEAGKVVDTVGGTHPFKEYELDLTNKTSKTIKVPFVVNC